MVNFTLLAFTFLQHSYGSAHGDVQRGWDHRCIRINDGRKDWATTGVDFVEFILQLTVKRFLEAAFLVVTF